MNARTPLNQPAGDEVKETRKPLNEARHVPGHYYTSPEIYELERQRIFLRDWLPVARVEEFEKAGDYLSLRIADEPLIVARDADGGLNAFMNRCAHRGVAVAGESGNANSFSCPYHGWNYDLQGRLLGAPSMEQAVGFDRKNCRLKPVALGTWGGWVFISFAPDPVPFEEWIAPYDAELGFLKQEECRLADKLVLDVDCNWKFPAENLMDNYHSRVLHMKTIGPTMGVERFKGVREGRAAFNAYYDARPMVPDGKSRFGIMPWLEGKTERFACSAHIAPNMHLFARCDNVHPFLMWPLGVGRTRIVCYMLWPKAWHEQPDFRERVEPYNVFTRQLMDEDSSVMESLHDAARSTLYVPGRMSHLELGVHNLINYNLDRVLGTGGPKLY